MNTSEDGLRQIWAAAGLALRRAPRRARWIGFAFGGRWFVASRTNFDRVIVRDEHGDELPPPARRRPDALE